MSDPRGEYSKRLESYLQIRRSKKSSPHPGRQFQISCRRRWTRTRLVLSSQRSAFLPTGCCNSRRFRISRSRSHTGKSSAQRSRAESAAAFYRRGIARIEDRWAGIGQTGDRFRNDQHVYADDLDLFGRGCLFELLSTARLPMGENWLAEWLCASSSEGRTFSNARFGCRVARKARSASRPGRYRRRTARAVESRVADGLGGKQSRDAGRLCASCGNRAGAVCRRGDRLLPGNAHCIGPSLTVLMIEVFFRRWFRRQAHAVIEGISCNAEGLLLFADILAPARAGAVHVAALAGVRHGASSRRTARFTIQFAKLARIVYWIDAHHSLLGHLVELPLLYTLQVAFAAESWRRALRCSECAHGSRSSEKSKR